MASNAVNAKSFATYIASVSRMIDGSALSADQQTQLKNFLLENFSNSSVLINIKTAQAMLNKLRNIMSVSSYSVTVSGGTLQSALSVNSAKKIVDIMYPVGVRDQFTTLRYVYASTVPTTQNGYRCSLTMIDKAGTSKGISGTLYGGGGGGSGAVGGDGDKNASYTCISGSGASGGDSTFVITNESGQMTHTTTVKGGAGGGWVSTGKVGGNPSIATNGNAGSNGGSSTLSTTIYAKYTLRVNAGAGGGGGAGCTASAGGTTGTVTWTGKSGSGTTGGSAVTTANEWSGADNTFSGGGGGGSNTRLFGGSTYVGQYGSSVVTGPVNYMSHSGDYGNPNRGGSGGYFEYMGNEGTLNTSPTSQPTTYATGGYAGKAGIITDVAVAGNGGNGGNRGGFVADTSCSAIDALMVIIYDK